MNDKFSEYAKKVSEIIGSPYSFVVVLIAIIIWALIGDQFGYSTNWRDVVKMSSAILSIITLFILQNTQNRDTKSINIKLDELLRTNDGARNELIDLENCSQEDLDRLEKEFKRIRDKRFNQKDRSADPPT